MKEVTAIQQARVVVVGACEFLDDKKYPPLGTC
jgi:hypothetical protein